MRRRDIVIGCFVGSFLGTLVAWILAPHLLALGLLAGVATGFFAGYVACDVPGVWRSVVRGWKSAKTENVRVARVLGKLTFQWLKKNRTEVLVVAIFALLGWAITIFVLLRVAEGNHWFWAIACSVGWILPTALLSNVILLLPHEVMLHTGRGYFVDTWLLWKKGYVEGVGKGRQMLKLTVFNVFLLSLCGWLAGLFYHLPRIIYLVVKFLVCFVWASLKFMHSKKRVLCATDSAIGVVVTFVFFYNSQNCLFAAACDGFIGAALGVISYELISKRLLKLAPA